MATTEHDADSALRRRSSQSGKIGARPQFRDRDIDRARPGVELAVAIAIAGADPVGAARVAAGPAHRVNLILP